MITVSCKKGLPFLKKGYGHKGCLLHAFKNGRGGKRNVLDDKKRLDYFQAMRK